MSAKKLHDPLHIRITPPGSQFPHILNSHASETVAGAIPEEETRLDLFLKKEEPFSGGAHLIRWGINE